MSKRAQRHYDEIDKAIVNTREITGAVIEMLEFLNNQAQGDNPLLEFAIYRLAASYGHLTTAKNHAIVLHNLADPSEPDELPF